MVLYLNNQGTRGGNHHSNSNVYVLSVLTDWDPEEKEKRASIDGRRRRQEGREKRKKRGRYAIKKTDFAILPDESLAYRFKRGHTLGRG